MSEMEDKDEALGAVGEDSAEPQAPAGEVTKSVASSSADSNDDSTDSVASEAEADGEVDVAEADVPAPVAVLVEAGADDDADAVAAVEAAPKPKRARKPKAEAAGGDVEKPAAAKPAARRTARGRGEAAKPAAAPSRRARSRRKPGEPVPVVRAQAKYVRSSARKARLVCDHIRGKSVEDARAILAHTTRAVARDWSKLLESAIANAEHNHELVGEDLFVKAVHADEGPTIKRFRPRAQGRATKIRKRTAHLTILLTPKD